MSDMPYKKFSVPLPRRRFLSRAGKSLAASFFGAALWPAFPRPHGGSGYTVDTAVRRPPKKSPKEGSLFAWIRNLFPAEAF